VHTIGSHMGICLAGNITTHQWESHMKRCTFENSFNYIHVLAVMFTVSLILAGFWLLMCVPQCLAGSDPIVLATVNGQQITDKEFGDVAAAYKSKTGNKELTPEIKKALLQNMIRRNLILQQDSVKALRSEEDIRKKVAQYEDELVIVRFLESQVGVHVNVTDEEIQRYYDENRHNFSAPPKVEARHILMRTQQEAEQVLAKLKAGADFSQLAKEYSIDIPMALEGGSMGTIEQGKSLPALEKELFTLKKGEVSGIVATQYGYHILTVDKIIPTQFKSLDEVKDSIKKTLLQQKEAKAFDDMAKRLEENAQVTIFENQLSAKSQ
jgi:peptidyl-prolyl cis-trans isomerase C